MNKYKLYLLLSVLCITGYIWLAFSFYQNITEKSESGLCLFKHVTGIPCPSCGSTRSALSILKGNFTDAIIINPFGIIILFFMIVFPSWMFYDLILKKDSLYRFYIRSELVFKRRWVAIPAILIVLINWVWNIYKGI
jgi:hypothetical protein